MCIRDSNVLSQLCLSFGITKANGVRNDAPLRAIHGKSHSRPGRDGVQSQIIAELAELDYVREVCVPRIRSSKTDSLILNLVCLSPRKRSLLGLDVLATVNRAVEASFARNQIVQYGFVPNFNCALKRTRSPIASRQDVDRISPFRNHG